MSAAPPITSMTLRRPILTLLVLLISFAALIVVTCPTLPERLATHFGASGQPNGWMSRSGNALAIYLTAVALAGLIVGIMYAVRFFPPRVINLPARDYWLASERREETYRFLLRQGLWFACMEIAFMAGLYWLVTQANLVTPARLDHDPALFDSTRQPSPLPHVRCSPASPSPRPHTRPPCSRF